MRYKYLLSHAISPIVLLLCIPYSSNGQSHVNSKPSDNMQFKDYWYQGKAEITSYKLDQARYGQIHKGESVLIFVTEDFSYSKQAKLDNPAEVRDDAVSVLKLNFTKKFNTGIYPYSMMLSIFTPVDIEKYPHTRKVTASSQEWCGHTFTQLNLRNDRYQAILHSYFESEGEQNKKIPLTVLEDGLWTRIRIGPRNLPVGDVNLIPGLLTQRLRHTIIRSQTANISLKDEISGELSEGSDKTEEIMSYTIQYKDDDRTLVIYFQKNFPYQIVKWEETYTDGFGENAKKLTTIAVKDKTIMIDYWNKNKNTDTYLRDSLGLMNYR